jgi:hypothetical protein
MLSKNIFHIFNEKMSDSPDENTHMLACFIIDSLVVENNIYSKEFFNLFHSSIISEEEQLDDGSIIILFKDKNTSEEQYIQLEERLSSIILSNPLFIEVLDNYRWITIGSKYINNQFLP